THGDLTDSRVIGLLHSHLTSARAQTAPGSAHALDLKGLQSPDIIFWTGWQGEALIAMGALKRLSEDHGEIKSMHTVSAVRRQGVGIAMRQHIIAFAQSRGMSRLSLETGSWDYSGLPLLSTAGTASLNASHSPTMWRTPTAFS